MKCVVYRCGKSAIPPSRHCADHLPEAIAAHRKRLVELRLHTDDAQRELNNSETALASTERKA